MYKSEWIFQLALIIWTSVATASYRNHDTHNYYVLHLGSHISPGRVASVLGLDYEEPFGELPDHHTFSSPRQKEHGAETILEDMRLRRRARELIGDESLDGILWSQKLKLKPLMQKRSVIPSLRVIRDVSEEGVRPGKAADEGPVNEEAVAERDAVQQELSIQDPIFDEQWHLFNTVQLGHDINVTGVWKQGITGEGATAVMVDDGIDMNSEDLKENYFAKGSYDFNEDVPEPKPRLSDDRHGTRCAGEIAAVRNNVCGVGVAYNAKIGGLRILSKVITDEDEAKAMNYAMQDNQIYSCSWGPPDDGQSMDAPGILIRRAMVNAIQNGRQGKGNVYVFAAGNGRGSGDNCNFDGYTNSIYTVTIGGIDRKGKQTYYSEHCSAQLVVTYSSGSGDAIHTTDVGTNKCYSNHGGTSAAAPIGAGIFALAFSARPELTWRDLQNILVQTALPINEGDDWDITFSGRKFSHAYGYGKMDAYAIVEKAKAIDLLKPQAWYNSPWIHVNHSIPQGVEGLLSSFEVTEENLKTANFETVEHVTVTMNVEHTRRGDLSVELRSPANMVSHLSVTRRLDDAKVGYVDWTFMSVAHWGETGIGEWSVVVKDTEMNEHNGTFTDWKLTLWGECIDPHKQDLLPLPTEHDDDDHDRISATPTTVSVEPGAAQTDLPAQPTDHQDRPGIAKPKPGQTSGTSKVAGASETATSLPEAPPQEGEEDGHFLPHYFPTFGVSKRTQIWIYGALGIIILFCLGLGTYFFVQRRRRRRREKEDYEFDMLEEDEAMVNGYSGRGGRKKGRRAGELYDAFAGESDEEQLLSESSSEENVHEDEYDQSERYRDEDSGEGEKRGSEQQRKGDGGGGDDDDDDKQ